MKQIQRKQNITKSALAIFAGMALLVTAWADQQAPLVTAAASSIKVRHAYVANQVLVQFKSGLAPYQRQQKVAALSGARMQLASKLTSFAAVNLPANMSVEQAMQYYRNDPSVKHVQPNYIYHSSLLPDDSQFSQQWGLQNNGQLINNSIYGSSNPGVSGRDMDVTEAWNTLTDCRSVIVAVIDTGIEYTHQDLAANMWDGSAAGYPNHGWDFVGVSVIEYVTGHQSNITQDNDPAPMGGSEQHGTHVAATIGAVGNNALGTAGICWQVQLMSLRALDSLGIGNTLTIRNAIRFAADNGASVINMSLGFKGSFDQFFSDTIDYARSKDVLVIAAAGNEGFNMDAGSSTKEYPCAYTQDNLLCVAAVDQSFNRASFSNYGATSVDIAAPGTNILSAWGGEFFQEDFSSWMPGGGWTRATNCSPVDNLTVLVNPPDWCTTLPPPTYVNNLNDRATRSFPLSTATAATLLITVVVDTELNADYFTLNTDAASGDPFDGVNDTQVISVTGSAYKVNAKSYEIPINDCLNATCSMGVRLQTDNNDAGNEGVAIAQLEIMTLQPGGSVMRLLNGTSMATPHVSGVAALLRARNPSYTAVDTALAIIGGGEGVAGLATLTVSGKVVNAAGSLVHVNKPTGLSAVEVP